jgi:hypothetical protein
MDELLRTANKGEWSELYVFLKIMLERTLYAADEDLQPKTDEWFRFIKLHRQLQNGNIQTFDLSNEGIVIISQTGNSTTYSTLDLGEKTHRIFNRIKQGAATFVVEDAAALMSEYGINSIKAKSTSKSDIDAEVQVSNSPSRHKMGFSIKSYIGALPTLVNSSSHTNFVYEVTGFTGAFDEINSIEGKSKVRDRIAKIVENGGKLSFTNMQSEQFKQNLRMQDSAYPKVMAKMLLDFYSGKGNSLATLGQLASQDTTLDMTENEIQIATKRYLRSSALGMVPSREWSGKISAQGGYIVVLETGELVCYNIYFDDDFQAYLYANTRFDTPSTSKYDFGKLYEQGGKIYFKLNLQVRFKAV